MRSSWVLGLVLAVACGGGAGNSPAAPSPIPAPNSNGLQVVFVTYVGNRNHWADPSSAGPQLIARANGFWNGPKGSWGGIKFDGSTQGWIDTNATLSGCPSPSLQTEVAAVMGPIATNTIRVIVLPPGSPCNDITLGLVKSGAVIYTVTGANIEHEIGHALMLGHAKECHYDSPTAGCHGQDYGSYSIMGDGTYGDALTVEERTQIGAYGPSFTLATAATSQDVTLQISDTMTPGIKGLLVAPPGADGSLHRVSVELRSGNYLSFGTILRTWPEGSRSVLQDLDHLTTADRWRLNVGETYRDGTYYCVTLTAQNSTTATIHVDIPCSSGTDSARPK